MTCDVSKMTCSVSLSRATYVSLRDVVPTETNVSQTSGMVELEDGSNKWQCFESVLHIRPLPKKRYVLAVIIVFILSGCLFRISQVHTIFTDIMISNCSSGSVIFRTGSMEKFYFVTEFSSGIHLLNHNRCGWQAYLP